MKTIAILFNTSTYSSPHISLLYGISGTVENPADFVKEILCQIAKRYFKKYEFEYNNTLKVKL